jgi:hypothetical protein
MEAGGYAVVGWKIASMAKRSSTGRCTADEYLEYSEHQLRVEDAVYSYICRVLELIISSEACRYKPRAKKAIHELVSPAFTCSTLFLAV